MVSEDRRRKHHVQRRQVLCLGLAAAAAPLVSSPSRAETVIDLLRVPGHVGFMRHALAPLEGAPKDGDRVGPEIGPCATQRNINDVGRSEARRIAALFRQQGLVFEHVYTSAWCRCRETAELVMGRPVENLPALDSYFTSQAKATRGPAQIAALKRFLNETLKPADRALLVTHGSVIGDLTAIETGETEIVVVKADSTGGIKVIGHGVV